MPKIRSKADMIKNKYSFAVDHNNQLNTSQWNIVDAAGPSMVRSSMWPDRHRAQCRFGSNFVDGEYVAAPAKAATYSRQFTVKGEKEVCWEPRNCTIRRYSSEESVGQLRKCLIEKNLRIAVFGDSQLRTFVNALKSVLDNAPALFNRAKMYTNRWSVNGSSALVELVWDPLGELFGRIGWFVDLLDKLDAKALRKFVLWNPRRDKELNNEPRRFRTASALRASPEKIGARNFFAMWQERPPDVVLVGTGGWHCTQCIDFAESLHIERLMANAAAKLVKMGIKVVFVGAPAWPETLRTGLKRRITNYRLGAITQLGRELFRAVGDGVTLLPFYELSAPFIGRKDITMGTHYDFSVVLYSMVDMLGTIVCD
jgi:hypothetical protein